MPRSTGWREGGVLVAAAVAGALLAACTSSPGTPGTLPTTSATTAESHSTSPSPSESEELQVEEAVRGYFAAVNEATASGETTRLAAASTSSCPCMKLVQKIDQLTASGSIEGALWTLESVTVGKPKNGRSVSTVRYSTAPYRTVNKAGDTIDRYPGYRIESAVTTVRSGPQWLVASFTTISRVEA